jgi:hypothetical protein
MTTTKQIYERMTLLNNHTYERIIGQLYELLKAEKFDEALDLVRAEHEAIHGPN